MEGTALIYTQPTASSRALRWPPSLITAAMGSVARWLFLSLLVWKMGVIIPITYLPCCCEFS